MIGIFFFIVFFFGFGRFVVELFSGYRDVFLMKFSLLLMAISAGVYFSMVWLDSWQVENKVYIVSDLLIGPIFFIGAFICGLLGYFWLKKMK